MVSSLVSYCLKKLVLLGWSALVLTSAVSAARADCPDEPLICRAPLYKPLIYLGCAIAGNLSPGGMCWSWFPFGCFPCGGDAGQCNSLNPTECQGACQALTSLEYYDACDGGGGPPELAQRTLIPTATRQTTPANPATLPNGRNPPQKWVGTLTPKDGRPQQVTIFAWRYDQPHLRIETAGGTVWATDIVFRRDRISFGFFDNDEARCELRPNHHGAFAGTCVEPKAGKARLRIRLAAP